MRIMKLAEPAYEGMKDTAVEKITPSLIKFAFYGRNKISK